MHMNFVGRGGKHGIENMKHLRFVVSENCSLVGVLFCNICLIGNLAVKEF